MAAQLINCTPHVVTVFQPMGRAVSIQPSGSVARVELIELPLAEARVDGEPVEVTRLVAADVVGLPEPQNRTWYIVSSIVAQHLRDRRDLLVPYRTRRRNGRVVGCKVLANI